MMSQQEYNSNLYGDSHYFMGKTTLSDGIAEIFDKDTGTQIEFGE